MFDHCKVQSVLNLRMCASPVKGTCLDGSRSTEFAGFEDECRHARSGREMKQEFKLSLNVLIKD